MGYILAYYTLNMQKSHYKKKMKKNYTAVAFAALFALTPTFVFGAETDNCDIDHNHDHNHALLTPQNDSHIVGDVKDAVTGEHIPYATIKVIDTNILIASDATGHFLITGLNAGDVTIAVSSVGYETAEQVINVETDGTVNVNFDLSESSINMDEVVVSSNRNEINRREASTIVNVISPLTISTTASTCLTDILNYKPGLRTEQTCGNCGAPQLRINGLGGEYTQLMLDSRPIFSSLASVYGLDQIPAEMVERVEVIRGGGSALFGSNAIGGVVNIITKDPIRNWASLSNTTQLIDGTTFDVNTAINATVVSEDRRAGAYIYGSLKDRDGYDRNGDSFTDIPELKSENVGLRTFYKFSPYQKLTLKYNFQHDYRRGGDMLDSPAHESNIAEQLEHNINNADIDYSFSTDDYKHRFNVYTSMQSINRKSYFGTDQDLDAYGRTTDMSVVAGGQYTYAFDNLWFMPAELTAGVEYSYNNLQDEMLGYGINLKQRVDIIGAYLQNEWSNKVWSILVGARLDKHSLMDNPVVSPRATFRYAPIKEIGLRLSYSSGYRAPQTYDEDLHVGAVGGEVSLISLDPDLRPEYSHSVSASVDMYKNFGAWRTNLLVEGFYTNVNDVFYLQENGEDADGNLLLERTNISGSYVGGVNLELNVDYNNKFLIQSGYTLQKSCYKEAVAWSDDVEASNRVFRSPDYYGYISLGYNVTKQFNVTFTGTHTGSMLVEHCAGYIDTDRTETTEQFFDAMVRLAYTIPISKSVNFEISGGVKNILDSYQSSLDYGADKDAGYIYGPTLPRTYFIGAKFSL